MPSDRALHIVFASLVALGLVSCGSEKADKVVHETEISSITFVTYSDNPAVRTLVEHAVLGLEEQGYVEGVNLRVDRLNADGDMASLPDKLEQLDQSGRSLIIVLSTPVLAAAVSSIKQTNVVFSFVVDPAAVGFTDAKRSDYPNITGIQTAPPVRDSLDFILDLVPEARLVATCYNPSETNSIEAMREATEFLNHLYVNLEADPIGRDSDIAAVVEKMLARRPDAIWLPNDNSLTLHLDTAVRLASTRVPVVLNTVEPVGLGAIAGFDIDCRNAGHATGRLAAEVIGGAAPMEIPVARQTPLRTVMNYEAAKRLGLSIPLERRRNVEWVGVPAPMIEE